MAMIKAGVDNRQLNGNLCNSDVPLTSMRLSGKEQSIIHETIISQFGPKVSVYLFGSRTDDSKKGGDIDLLVVSGLSLEASIDRKIKTLARLDLNLGERKIDMIVTSSIEEDERTIVQEAARTGIKL